MKKRGIIIACAVALLFFVGCTGLLVIQTQSKSRSIENYDINGLPALKISLNGTTLSEINAGDKETKYENNQATFYNNSEITILDNVTIKGRGNTTWKQPKKPYQIELNSKTDLLGLGERSKWILMANYLDPSHLRNDTAFYLAHLLEEDFAPSGEPIELIIDDEDLGLYYLTPKIKISKNSVDLRDNLGILVELDNLHTDCNVKQCYYSDAGNNLIVSDIVDDNSTDAAVADFMQSYNELETAAAEGNFEKIKNLIDVESFAQYFLINEFANNPDAYATSWYMYKDGPDDKIHAGPIWDFDFAFGNSTYGWEEITLNDSYYPDQDLTRRIEAFGGTYCNETACTEVAEDKNISKLIYQLVDIPEFYAEIKRLYQEKIAGHKSEVLAQINRRANEIYIAALADHAKWELENFDSSVNYLYNWVARRYDHFESVYGSSNSEKVMPEL